MVTSIFRYILIFMIEWAGALAIYRNSLSLRISYVGGDFRGSFAAASLKPYLILMMFISDRDFRGSFAAASLKPVRTSA